MSALSELGNDRIRDGGNLPPAFDAHKVSIEDLREEAKAWLDGKDIDSAEEAEAVNLLLDMARKEAKAADDARATEKEPHLKAGREVDAKWKPLITAATTIADVCKQRLTPWNIKERQRKEAEAARIRAEAEAEAEAARQAMQSSSGDLAAREQAEQIVESAKQAQRVARSAEKAASTGNGLRSVKRLVVTDARALAGWLWTHRREEAEAAHAELARQINRAAGIVPGGTEIQIEEKAV